MENNEIRTLAFDLTRNSVKDHTVSEASDVLRQALNDLAGGESISMKSLRRHKPEYFELIEDLIPVIIHENDLNDEFFRRMVEERNVAEGDKTEFVVPSKSLFVVSEMANGIATPRRQRIGESRKVTIPTTNHGIRIYEEFDRFRAGRIDWPELVSRVAKSYRNKRFEDIYTVLSGVSADTQGLSSEYVYAGTYSEEEVLEVCDHVEADTGKAPVIFGTRPALRKCTSAVIADEAKSAYYNGGYYGKLAGVDMVYIPNQHKGNTNEFVFPDNKIWIFASDERPIKYVTEGDAWILEKTEGNADMTIEYTMLLKYGIGLVVNQKFGMCTFA